MPVNSTSVRGGIAAMRTDRTAELGVALEPNATGKSNGTAESEILLARSGYIVVAG